MAAPTLDGSDHATSGGTTSLPGLGLTTTGPGYVLAFPGGNGGPITGVSSPTLGAFTKKIGGGNTIFCIDCWYAVSSGALTGEIVTAVQTSNAFITLDVCGVLGATGFDVNAGAVVATTNNADLLVSTTAAQAIILAAYRMGSVASPTAGAAQIQISAANFQLAEYQRFSSPQVNYDMTLGVGSSGDPNGGVAVSLVGAAGGGLLRFGGPLMTANMVPLIGGMRG